MNVDFELKSGVGYLKLAGPLTGLDRLELKKTLVLSLTKCNRLELDIDNVTTISSACIKTIVDVYRIAKRAQRSLVFATRYPQESMMAWLNRMANVSQRK